MFPFSPCIAEPAMCLYPLVDTKAIQAKYCRRADLCKLKILSHINKMYLNLHKDSSLSSDLAMAS